VTNWPILVSGFTLGAAGSLHCLGMCGPLSLALPVHQLGRTRKFISLLSYQAGRIITYSLLGLILGLAGKAIQLAGYQQGISITMGLFVLGFAVLYIMRRRMLQLRGLNKFYLFIQKEMGHLLRSVSSPKGFLLMGMVNGLLPCGMVYVALAATISLTDIFQGTIFMALFGAGTLPAMMLAGYAGTLVGPRSRQVFRKLVPLFISLMGIILILRGLNLGIPFISPQLSPATGPQEVMNCHP
jgi:sulfite exporter TauE/SafE